MTSTASKTRLIVVADDLGYAPERDRGIVRVHTHTPTHPHTHIPTHENPTPTNEHTGHAVHTRILAGDENNFMQQSRLRVQFECARAGIVRAASLMVNGGSAASALRLAAGVWADTDAHTDTGSGEAATAAGSHGSHAAGNGLVVGLHLNLTEGTPISDADAVRSLLDPAAPGLFRGKLGLRAALDRGEVVPDEVRAEVRAQIRKFQELHPHGALPAHADGHQHVHVIPGIAAILAEEMATAGILRTRLPAIARVEDLSHLPSERREFYHHVSRGAEASREIYAGCGVSFADAFMGFSTMGSDCTEERVCALLEDVAREHAGATVEWMTHPGFRVPPPIAGHPFTAGCGGGPDDFAMSEDRETELHVWSSHAVLATIHEMDFALG